MKDNKIIKELVNLFWVFVVGCVLGYFIEMLVVLFQKGYFESRQGLIYGPFIPVYGIGIVIYYLFFKLIKDKDKLKVFLYSMVLGGLIEYMCSYFQEKLFGTISWDYSNLPFNFNGRTSLLHCTYWGIAGVLYTTYIEPLLIRMQVVLQKKSAKIVTLLFLIFMIFNIFISSVAGIRQKERLKDIPPRNDFERFVDKYYNDQYMDSIYTNKKEVMY